MGFVIAIDGPAGSGKGTVTKLLADKINFMTLDTGAFYRCVTLEFVRQGFKVEELQTEVVVNHLVSFAKNMKLCFVKNGVDKDYVYLNEENVSKIIRDDEVNNYVSFVSSMKEIREALLVVQREIGRSENVVMEGRDIGTVVFPNADVKIYLDAELRERAARRYLENLDKGINMSPAEVLDNLRKRDEIDSKRECSPLKKADDAIVLDNTDLSAEETADMIVDIYKTKRGII